MSWSMALIRAALRLRVKRRSNVPLHEIRESLEKLTRFQRAVPEDLEISDMWVGNVSALRVDHSDGQPRPQILYLHGGGYCFASPNTHRTLLTYLAKICNATVVAPHYRLAPENPYPAALQDAATVYSQLASQGGGRPLFVGGDSAGGGLTFALTRFLRREGLNLPRALFTFSPWTDLAITGDSVKCNARSEDYLSEPELRRMAGYYIGDGDPRDPLISPLYGDFHGFPPCLIQVSNSEILRDDSLRLAAKMERSGVPVILQTRNKMPHVWQVFVGRAPESSKSVRQVAEFLAEMM